MDYSEWLCKQFNTESPKDAIRNAVSLLLKNAKQNEIPIKLSEIAKSIGINPYPLYRNQTPSGQLICINNEFRISLKMKSGKPPSVNWHGYPKLRFSYAHELIHCLGYDFSTKPPNRIAPYTLNNKEEILCNFGANLLVLPDILVKSYIATLQYKDIIYVAGQLAKKAQVSFHTALLNLINMDYLNCNNKLYILSMNSEGYRERGEMKPRCLLSALYLDDSKLRTFLPTYKGIEVINKSWSLLLFHQKIYENHTVSEQYVRNEIIEYCNKTYIVNGTHFKISNSGYIWSDLTIFEIK